MPPEYEEISREQSVMSRPSPSDFESFIPWACLEYMVLQNIRIISKHYDNYQSPAEDKKTKLRKENKKNDKESITTTSNVSSSAINPNAIPITIYRDQKEDLIEIAIINPPAPIQRKIFRVINLCIPHHNHLNKLTLHGTNALNDGILHEICRILPKSNVSNICLDDTNLAGGKYYVLLESTTRLEHISLSRCNITDNNCKEIADKLSFECPSHKNLKTLDLSCNKITDLGAYVLSKALRSNRVLLHLNLSGNMITDTGAGFIFDTMTEFMLTNDEKSEAGHRYKEYVLKKAEVYKTCLEKILSERAEVTQKPELLERNSPLTGKQIKTRKSDLSLLKQIANIRANKIVRTFDHPFQERSLVQKNGILYSKGNLRLCSLNLAFNNLSDLTPIKLNRILRYQNNFSIPGMTGLIRVILDGNNFTKMSSKELNKKRWILAYRGVQCRQKGKCQGKAVKKMLSNVSNKTI